MNTHHERANVLIEALPYIQRLSGKTIVVKYGGAAMLDDNLKKRFMEDITLLKFVGMNPIVAVSYTHLATLGGSLRPRSSPWTMISPPIIRVEVPQDVCQGYFSLLSLSRY